MGPELSGWLAEETSKLELGLHSAEAETAMMYGIVLGAPWSKAGSNGHVQG